MKTIFYTTIVALGTVIVMASCKDNNKLATESAVVTPVPAAEYARFQEWKQQQQAKTTASYTTNTTATRPIVVHKHYVINKTVPAPVAHPAKKKGWGKAAKGSVIGAGAGAAAGALLVKNNRALGAVIGGVLGGGVGYAIGRSGDKKDGSY